jgi:hypothetical protein
MSIMACMAAYVSLIHRCAAVTPSPVPTTACSISLSKKVPYFGCELANVSISFDTPRGVHLPHLNEVSTL